MKRAILTLCATLLLGGLAARVDAASISLTPQAQTVDAGGSLLLDLTMDFSDDPTVGGGVDIFYDASKLTYVGFVFNSGWGNDAFYNRQPDNIAGELNGLAFGSDVGVSGPATVGTLTFTAGPGQWTTALTMAANDSPAGGFYSARTFTLQTVSYQGATASTVPLPGAVWLLGSGLAAMVGLRRRQQ